MEDDPDDLAAAFFAAQAAKEQQKAKLPTEDWIAAIHSIRAREKAESDVHSITASVQSGDICGEASTWDEPRYDAAVSRWLVTTIPDVPIQTKEDTGFTEIELNVNECNAFNLLQRDSDDSHIRDSPSLSIFEEDAGIAERRERIKQNLVQILLRELDRDTLTTA